MRFTPSFSATGGIFFQPTQGTNTTYQGDGVSGLFLWQPTINPTTVASGLQLQGILASNTAGATGATVQLFATATATATAKALTGVITFPTGVATYLTVPAYSPSGLSALVKNGTDADLTLFWSPAD